MSEAVALIVGATLSATVAVLVVAVQHRLSTRAVMGSDRAQRLAEFSAAGHAAVIHLGEVARSDSLNKVERESLAVSAEIDRFNTLLSSVRLLEDERVIAAALAIDGELVRLSELARTEHWERDAWRATRGETMSGLVNTFQHEARRALGSPPLSAAAPRLVMP